MTCQHNDSNNRATGKGISMSENASPVAPVQNIVHTPGPWVARRGEHGWGIDRSSRHGICTIHDNTDGSMRDEQAANARLIAAAPEMLDLLRRLVHGELPQADDDCTPDNVKLTVSHMDHEDYRHRIRQAKELIARVV